jgi:hypothetical protein
MALVKSWKQAFSLWAEENPHIVPDVLGGVSPDWSDYQWAYIRFLKMLLECYPPECIELDIDATLSNICEDWPGQRDKAMAIHTNVALSMATGYSLLGMLAFVAHILKDFFE